MNAKIQTLTDSLLASLAATLVAAVLVTSNASADEVRSETVKFGDLNVNTQAGAEALYGRIHAAATRVCIDRDDVWGRYRTLPCIKSAEANAVDKVNMPLLTAYYQMKSGSQSKALIAKR